MSVLLPALVHRLNTGVQRGWLRQVGAWDKTLTRKEQFVAAK